ncbi:MAG: hypothetical protein ACYDEN_08195 [Acidimicrobiales bacterium]
MLGRNVEDPAREALADLHRARRARRVASIDFFEALYRAYLTAVLAGVALWLGSGVVGDTKVGAGVVAGVAAHGAQVVGLTVAAVFAVGLRSGAQGGPLALEAPDVRHVLLAPVDRTAALRPQAWKQLRSGVLGAAGTGALLGLLAYRRLPGGVVAWIVCGGAAAALAVLGAYGLALTASGLRIGKRVGTLLAAVVAGWGAADYLTGLTTSPMTLLGELALWPLRLRAAGAVGVILPAAAAVTGLAVVGGTSVEAAERRSSLVGQLRFAATLRDLRTVVVLRRQLAQEVPRQRPWLRLTGRYVAAAAVSGTARDGSSRPPRRAARNPFPAWRRGWQGILRFPGLRLGRLVVLGALAGLALLGAWRGTTPLVFAGGLALYLAALDAVEPVAQEADHPDRRDAYGLEAGDLYLRQSVPSLVVMTLVGLCGAGAAALAGGSVLGLEVGAVMAVPAAVTAVAGALLSTVQGPPALFSSSDSLMPPEMAGMRNLLRTIIPPAVAIIGTLPVLAGRHPRAGLGPVGATASVLPEIVFAGVLALAWVRYQQRVVEWWRQSMRDAQATRRPSPRAPS